MALTDTFLDQLVAMRGGTIDADTATFDGDMEHTDLRELMRVAKQARYDVALVAGVLTVAPMTTSG